MEHAPAHRHEERSGLSLGNKLALGTAALAGGIIVSPYLLPALGIGDPLLAEKSISALCDTGQASGLAGELKDVLAQIPVIGSDLAQGGWTNAATAAATGLGGHFLANAVSKTEEDDVPGIRWSRVIRYTALATTMLVALPSILTGISAGIVYLSGLLGGAELASNALGYLSDTLGTTGSNTAVATGITGLASSTPHLLTCGLSLFPATLPWLLGKGFRQEKESPTTAPSELYLNATTAQPLSPGQPNTILIRLADKEGHPVTPEQLAEVHEKKLHVFVTDTGRGEYHHIHPEPTRQPGIYAVPFTPQGSGSYQLWAEATPAHTMHEHILRACLPSLAAPSARFDFRPNRQAAGDGLVMKWTASPPLRQGTTSTVTLTVTDAQGKPVTLEPHLGAMAHLAGFTEGDQSLIHTHAEETPQPQTGPLHIRLTPVTSGRMRFFVEVNHGGKVTAASFDQSVFPGKAQAQNVETTAPHGGHAVTATGHGRF